METEKVCPKCGRRLPEDVSEDSVFVVFPKSLKEPLYPGEDSKFLSWQLIGLN